MNTTFNRELIIEHRKKDLERIKENKDEQNKLVHEHLEKQKKILEK